MAQRRSWGCLRLLMIPAILVTLAYLAVSAFRAGPSPEISIKAELPGIGRRTPLRVHVAEPRRGLAGVRVEFIQGDRVETLETRSYTPRAAWRLWGPRQESEELALEIGSETLRGIKEGPAKIRVVADRAGAWLRSPAPAVAELELPVKLRPPALQVLSAFTYVMQGGSEAVVYQVGPSSVQDGVEAGPWWFPGYPLPGGAGRKFVLFGAPYDVDDSARIRLVARDDVGNESRAAFIDRFTPRPPRRDRIEVSDEFLSRVVPAILAQAPELTDRGSLLDNYLAINGELRKIDNALLAELAARTAPEFLWREPFQQMHNAQVTANFADRRTYYYHGREVDRQDHLGFDLAAVRQAPIQAANAGRVLFARYLGIYGNAVVVDHGFGLMSLYGHLSSIAVQDGQIVTRGELLGRSGDTGLAGGDHLHFTMLLRGLPVDPREWWDGHWIHDRLALKLGAALPLRP